MNRLERYHAQHQTKPFFLKGILIVTILFCGLIITTHLYLKSQIKIETPEVELGPKVIIQLPNGKEIQTFKNLIVERDGKMYYEGEWNSIDVTGGIVVYKEWE